MTDPNPPRVQKQVLMDYKRTIQDKLPYMDGSNRRRALRTIKALNRQADEIGRAWPRRVTW